MYCKEDTINIHITAIFIIGRVIRLDIREESVKSDIKKNFFAKRVVRHWNKLPRKGVESPTPEVSKKLCGCGTWGYGLTVNTVVLDSWFYDFRGLFQPLWFYDSGILNKWKHNRLLKVIFFHIDNTSCYPDPLMTIY